MLSPKNQLSNVKVEQNAEIQFLLQEKIHVRALPFQQHCAEAIAVRFTDLRPMRAHSMLGIEYPGHLSDNGRTSPRLCLSPGRPVSTIRHFRSLSLFRQLLLIRLVVLVLPPRCSPSSPLRFDEVNPAGWASSHEGHEFSFFSRTKVESARPVRLSFGLDKCLFLMTYFSRSESRCAML